MPGLPSRRPLMHCTLILFTTLLIGVHSDDDIFAEQNKPPPPPHPCTAEVASACPGLSGREVGKCLADASRHKKPTMIAEVCVYFVALNEMCHESLAKTCGDSIFYTDKLFPCMVEHTPRGMDAVQAGGKAVNFPEGCIELAHKIETDQSDVDPEFEIDYNKEEASKQQEKVAHAARDPQGYLDAVKERAEAAEKAKKSQAEEEYKEKLEKGERMTKILKEMSAAKKAKQQSDRSNAKLMGVVLLLVVVGLGAFFYHSITSGPQASSSGKLKTSKKHK